MKTINKYLPFFTALVLFIGVLVFIYPYYRYYIDTDATAYLTIAQRYADGDYFNAINGYWSPLACWMTAWFIKTGYEPVLAAVIVNATAAAFFLFISQSFLLLFGVIRKWQWLFCFTLALFLSYAVFKQLFDDLWECFFLLSSLRIMLHENFRSRADLWVWSGIAGGFAYYAKAYSFPFFIINTLCCTFIVLVASQKKDYKQWIKISAVAIGTMILIASPWIYLLHEKYSLWMTSTAGTLNLSWYPVGHPYFKEGIQYILPPPYVNSPSYWEDPWLVNGITPHFWNSGLLFLRQIARVVYNQLLFIKCLNEMSAFLFPVFILAITILLSKQVRQKFEKNVYILSISFLLFPLGFVLINFEARYIWYILLPGMVLGALFLQKILTPVPSLIKNVVVLLYVFSFLAWPLWDMKQMYRQGEEQYQIAQELKRTGIKGSFTSNVVFGEGNDLEEISRIAYFSGNPYYNMPYPDVSYDSLLNEIRRYDIKYFYYYHKPGVADIVLYNESGLPAREETNSRYQRLKVFRLPQ